MVHALTNGSSPADRFEGLDAAGPHVTLALAYTPPRCRDGLAIVLALDTRLAGIVRTGREDMLKQIRLAWWRDRLAEEPEKWPTGEPLLDALRQWPGERVGLAALVDGWEALIAEGSMTRGGIDRFVAGRVAAMTAALGHQAAGMARKWAIADLAGHLGDPNERALALAMLGEMQRAPGAVPAAARGVAVLAKLASAVRADQEQGKMARLATLAGAIRVGLIGR